MCCPLQAEAVRRTVVVATLEASAATVMLLAAEDPDAEAFDVGDEHEGMAREAKLLRRATDAGEGRAMAFAAAAVWARARSVVQRRRFAAGFVMEASGTDVYIFPHLAAPFSLLSKYGTPKFRIWRKCGP